MKKGIDILFEAAKEWSADESLGTLIKLQAKRIDEALTEARAEGYQETYADKKPAPLIKEARAKEEHQKRR